MPPTKPTSQAQLLWTQIKLLETDRERHIERHKQALCAIDHHISNLRQRLASLADGDTTTNETAAPQTATARFEL